MQKDSSKVSCAAKFNLAGWKDEFLTQTPRLDVKRAR